MLSSQDPREVLRAEVAITRRFRDGAAGEAVHVLFAAAESEPALRAAAAEGRRRHRHGAEETARRLEELDALRDGVLRPEAAAAISTLTSHTVYAQLVSEHGWTVDECERWIAAALERLLLAPRRRGRQRRVTAAT